MENEIDEIDNNTTLRPNTNSNTYKVKRDANELKIYFIAEELRWAQAKHIG